MDVRFAAALGIGKRRFGIVAALLCRSSSLMEGIIGGGRSGSRCGSAAVQRAAVATCKLHSSI